MSRQPDRRPGDPDAAPDRQAIEQPANVLRYDGLGETHSMVGGPGQTATHGLSQFFARRKQEKAKRAAMAAYRTERQARRTH